MAKLSYREQVVFIPIKNWVKGPIIDGIIARDINTDVLRGLIDQLSK